MAMVTFQVVWGSVGDLKLSKPGRRRSRRRAV